MREKKKVVCDVGDSLLAMAYVIMEGRVIIMIM